MQNRRMNSGIRKKKIDFTERLYFQKTMNKFFVFVLFACLLASCVLGRERSILRKFERISRSDGNVEHEVTVLLRQQNLAKLTRFATTVSDPTSANYGKYIGVREIAGMIAPSHHSIDAVLNYFGDARQVELSLSRDFIRVRDSIDYFERKFSVRFHRYEHKGSRRAVHRVLIDADEALARAFPDDSGVRQHVQGLLRVHDFFEIGGAEKKALRALEARQRLANAGDAGSDAPYVNPVLIGGADSAAISVEVYCKDGKPATDAAAPCASRGAAVKRIDATFWNLVDRIEVSLESFESCSARGGGAVSCQFAEFFLQKYRRYNISATTTFADGSTSAEGQYPTAFAPTDYITPQSLRDYYKIPRGLVVEDMRSTQAVTAFEDQFVSIADARQFQDEMGLDWTLQNYTIHGNNDESQPGGESTLDFQWISAVGQRSPTTFWSVSGPVTKGAYVLEWALQVANTSIVPLSWSTSYGDFEGQFYINYGNSWEYIERMETQLQAMAARGLTTAFGSGDAGFSNVGESGNDLKDVQQHCDIAAPFYPASSPWALGVSATFLTYDSVPVCREGDISLFSKPVFCSSLGEVAVSIRDGLFWTTGGGTSNIFGRTEFEREAVDHYFAHAPNLPSSSAYNASNHLYPQLSAIGHQLLMIMSGSLVPIDGTSASSPVTAGLIALLNDVRFRNGHPPLGRVTPLLFHLHRHHPEVFNDVVVGRNADADIQPRGSPYPTHCDQGFDAAPGIDPVTGFGSINFPEFVEFMRSRFDF
jgi:subtilase family serine protease